MDDQHELLALDSVASEARAAAVCRSADATDDGKRAPAARCETSGTRERGEATSAGPLGRGSVQMNLSVQRLRSAGGPLALGYGVVHLLVAAALDFRRATPALALAAVTVLWYASGQPWARAQWQQCFRAVDKVMLGVYHGRGLGLVASTQLLLVVVAVCIIGVTLLQHFQRAGMTFLYKYTHRI